MERLTAGRGRDMYRLSGDGAVLLPAQLWVSERETRAPVRRSERADMRVMCCHGVRAAPRCIIS